MKGQPTQAQLYSTIARQILNSLHRQYINISRSRSAKPPAGRTSWGRAIFENSVAIKTLPSYNIWEYLPRHPLSVCDYNSSLDPALEIFNQAGLPTRTSAHPQDKFISFALISCLDDDPEDNNESILLPITTEYTAPLLETSITPPVKSISRDSSPTLSVYSPTNKQISLPTDFILSNLHHSIRRKMPSHKSPLSQSMHLQFRPF